MSLEILNIIVSKNEILEKIVSIFDFQDEYIDSYTQEIANKISEEFGIEADAFSDQVWLNSYIIFRKDDMDILKMSFDEYVKSFDEDEEPNNDFMDTISTLPDSLPEQFNLVISFDTQSVNKTAEKILDNKTCSFLNNKVSLNNIGWLGFTKSYNKEFPPKSKSLNRPRILLYTENNNLSPDDFNLNEALKFFNEKFRSNGIVFPDTITFEIELESNHFNIYLFVDDAIVKSLKKVKAFNKHYLGTF